jgi:nucleotide-binding universal stress UspA family protein
MQHTILVPLDSSQLGATVVPYVRTLAKLFSARVHLLHVYEIDEVLFREHYHDVKQQLEQDALILGNAGIDVEIDIRSGHCTPCILETAQRLPATMIAMATHGLSGFRRWALGSVTDKVVHAANVPIFVVRSLSEPESLAHDDFKLNRILVPLDGSDFSRRALDRAIQLASLAGADIHLLHVISFAEQTYPPGERLRRYHYRRQEAMADMAKLTEHELMRMSDAIRDGVIGVSWHVTTGYPAEKIIDEAAYQESDLIVMATHGYGGLQRWALGSTADKVLHAAHLPLMLVREPVTTG